MQLLDEYKNAICAGDIDAINRLCVQVERDVTGMDRYVMALHSEAERVCQRVDARDTEA